MSSVRIKRRSRPPLAFVPFDNKAVAVSTENAPQPEPPNSPVNRAYFEEHAAQLASSSSSQPVSRITPRRSRSKTYDYGHASPLVTSPKRQAASVSSRESLTNEPKPEFLASQRASWFRDHVMRPRSSTVLSSPSPAIREPRLSSDRGSIAGPLPQVEVIIPDEARSTLGQALASQDRIHPESPVSDEVHHHENIVEHLDVIDARISTVSHLSNAANSILLPPLSFYSRKPSISLPPATIPEDVEKGVVEEEEELDRHVEDVLRKRDKIRRGLQGVWAFLKTPIGVLTGIYGFLVVFWGAAIVFFLAKWIDLHDAYKQGFWVEISSQVVNALFTVQGVGFLPWRIMDTWNIFWIAHYKRLDQRLRREAKLPPVGDPNDIPDSLIDSEHVQVLSDKQLETLRRYQVRFLKSQTWYRPHATDTHKAFSIKWAIAICICVDLNSVFQILLCGCMWGLNRFERPAWTIGALIPLGFISGIGAAVLIWKGGERSKKTEEVEERLRDALDQEKKILREREVAEASEAPVLVGRPSELLQDPSLPRRSQPNPYRQSSRAQSIKIDEVMSIPEDVEEIFAKPSPNVCISTKEANGHDMNGKNSV